MGIEKFFKTIADVTQSVSEASYKSDISFFYFDFNSIIYDVFNVIEYELNYIVYCNVYKKTDENQYIILKNKWRNIVKLDPLNDLLEFKKNKELIYKIILQGIEEYIIFIIDKYTITDRITKIFIGMDGIPSFPKVIEQRKRRMFAFMEGKIIKKIKENMGINAYKFNNKIDENRIEYEKYKIELDRSELIPYSILMNLISEYMNSSEFINEIKSLCINLKSYTYSGNNEFGEGERKIIWNILKEKNKGNYMVHSPDADVILLSTLMQNKIDDSKFKIMRVKFEKDRLLYDIIDCIEFRDNISNGIDKDKKRVINDVIFLYTFFGNDFLPKIETINVRTSINTILSIYSIYIKTNDFIIDNEINWENFIKILAMFADKELLFANDIYMSMNYKNYHYLMSSIPCLNIEFIEKFNNINDKINNIKKMTPYKQEEEINNDIELKETLEKVLNTVSVQGMVKKIHNDKCVMKLLKKEDKITDKQINRISQENICSVVNIDIEIYKIRHLMVEYFKIFNAKNDVNIGKVSFDYNSCYIINSYPINYKKYYDTYFDVKKEKVIEDYLIMYKYVFDVYFNDIDMDNDKIQTFFYKYYKSPLLKDIYNYLKDADIDKLKSKVDNKLKKREVNEYFTLKEHSEYVKTYDMKSMDEMIELISKGLSIGKYIDCSNVSYFNKCHYKEHPPKFKK